MVPCTRDSAENSNFVSWGGQLGIREQSLLPNSKFDLQINLNLRNQVIPGNDQNTSPTNQKTAGSKLERTS